MRAIAASITSTGDISRRRIRAASDAAVSVLVRSSNFAMTIFLCLDCLLDHCTDRRFGRRETIILGWAQLTAHEHMVAPEAHAARLKFKSRKMYLLWPCRRNDAIHIAGRDATSWNDHDAVSRSLHEFGNHRQAFQDARLLARSENPVDAEVNKGFKCGEGIRSHIEGPMESDGHWSRQR